MAVNLAWANTWCMAASAAFDRAFTFLLVLIILCYKLHNKPDFSESPIHTFEIADRNTRHLTTLLQGFLPK